MRSLSRRPWLLVASTLAVAAIVGLPVRASGLQDDAAGEPSRRATPTTVAATAPPSTVPAPAPTTVPLLAPEVPAPPALPAPEPVPAEPDPAPQAAEPAPTPPADPLARAGAALAATVPQAWRDAVSYRLELIAGATSWAHTTHLIQISSRHADGDQAWLNFVVAHEFGHLIAFQYGSQSALGAAPAGWPVSGSPAVEAWGDCVATVFAGPAASGRPATPCTGDSLAWTADWLAQGPAAHPVTG